MKLCFVGHFTAGGTERAMSLVANGLKEKGYEIYIINTADRKPSFSLDEIEMEYLPAGSIPKRITMLTKYLRAKKIDILIPIEALTGILTIAAAKLAGCKYIVWEHANYYQNQGSKHMQQVRQLELLTADAYVVLTERDLENFKRHFKVRTKLVQIYNIANPTFENAYQMNSKTIISAGHINKIKNFIIIPDIAKIVFEKNPDWNWKIYGEASGEVFEQVRKKVEEFGLEERVIFCGRCSDMDTEYKKAAMFVLTSLQEGLPMVLLEAKSNQLPLVSFDIETGPDEIIRDNINGFLVPPYDVKCMAERICQLIENKRLRKSMSEQSLLDLEQFSHESVLEKWNLLLKEAIDV